MKQMDYGQIILKGDIMLIKVKRNKIDAKTFEVVASSFFHKVAQENGPQFQGEVVVSIQTQDEWEAFRLGSLLAISGLKKSDITREG